MEILAAVVGAMVGFIAGAVWMYRLWTRAVDDAADWIKENRK